jgi:D-tyrosyl-tRNA(Tyr) deacylase
VRAVLQRVTSARVSVDARVVGEIGPGLLVFVGVEAGDRAGDVAFVAGKIRDLRVFADEQGRMNRSVVESGGAVLLVSQFTLLGDCRKGRRPSFDQAAAPAAARQVYEDVATALRQGGVQVATGEFQAMMRVELVNDGPVTLLLDSHRRF